MRAQRLAEQVATRLGAGAISEVSERGASTVTADVPPWRWLEALTMARDQFGCDVFDWLSAVDELGTGLAIVAHVYARDGGHHLLLRTRVAGDSPHLPTAASVYQSAAACEWETAAASGAVFDGHPGLCVLPGGAGDDRARDAAAGAAGPAGPAGPPGAARHVRGNDRPGAPAQRGRPGPRSR